MHRTSFGAFGTFLACDAKKNCYPFQSFGHDYQSLGVRPNASWYHYLQKIQRNIIGYNTIQTLGAISKVWMLHLNTQYHSLWFFFKTQDKKYIGFITKYNTTKVLSLPRQNLFFPCII